MSDTYDVYGARLDLETAASRIARALDIELEARSSDYVGDYYGTPLPDETVEIFANVSNDRADMPYEEYAEFTVIVEVSESPVADAIRDKLVELGFSHLDREII